MTDRGMLVAHTPLSEKSVWLAHSHLTLILLCLVSVKFLGVGKLSNKLLVASFAQGRSNEVWYKKMNALMNAPTTGYVEPTDNDGQTKFNHAHTAVRCRSAAPMGPRIFICELVTAQFML